MKQVKIKLRQSERELQELKVKYGIKDGEQNEEEKVHDNLNLFYTG